jgi:hypothetical protein
MTEARFPEKLSFFENYGIIPLPSPDEWVFIIENPSVRTLPGRRDPMIPAGMVYALILI